MPLPAAGARVRASDWLLPFPLGVDAWTPYTPTWTSSGVAPALGNGSISGRYTKVGRTVLWFMALTMGSTTTYGTGNYFFSLPVTAGGSTSNNPPYGRASIVDTSAGTRFMRDAIISTPTTVVLLSEGGTFVGSATPMTWANTDAMSILGHYEAAS